MSFLREVPLNLGWQFRYVYEPNVVTFWERNNGNWRRVPRDLDVSGPESVAQYAAEQLAPRQFGERFIIEVLSTLLGGSCEQTLYVCDVQTENRFDIEVTEVTEEMTDDR